MINDIMDNIIKNNNHMTEIYIAEGITIGIILFAIYLEVNPKLGNIWLRKDEHNVRQFSPYGFLEYFKQPFKNKFLWFPQNWDLNPYMFTTITTLSFTGLRKYFDYN